MRNLLAAGAALALAGCSVTPEALTLADHAQRMASDAGFIFKDQDPVTGPITLEEAVARAIKYNLDHRVTVMERALANHQLTSANLNMLPALTARAGYTGRDNKSGSNSVSLTDGSESLESSSSSDRDLKTFDLTLTWNILDLGMSYVRAKQQADRLLIVQERRRKVLHNVIQNVRTAYWTAASAERLLGKVAALTVTVNRALDDARQAQKQGAEDPLSALRYRRDLLDTQRQLKILTRELETAKYTLASMMNLKPGTPYSLDLSTVNAVVPEFQLDVEQLERMALVHRPELREEDYQDRISHQDVKLAYMSMIPGLSLQTAYNADSNSYAYNQSWYSWGSTITGNLFDVYAGPKRVAMSEAVIDVAKTRRMALSMAVMSQVHISLASYNQAIGEFKTANELSQVEYEIFDKTRADVQSGSDGPRTAITAELDALLAELRQDIAFAKVRNAVGNIYATIGADPLPETIDSHDLKDVASAFKKVNDGWFMGKFDLLDPITVSQKADENATAVVASNDKSPGVFGWFTSLFSDGKAN